MSGFSSEWLQMREPLDCLSRSSELTASLARYLDRGESRINVVDLGAGTGANLRYLAPRIHGAQNWLLVDHDPGLLACLGPLMRTWAAESARTVLESSDHLAISGQDFDCQVRTFCCDLAADLDPLVFPDRCLVTASALLDLVSESWLASLAQHCVKARAAVYFPLIYDGRIFWIPSDPDDGEVCDLVNKHQRMDKGFGSALGPSAAAEAVSLFTSSGYHVETALSDWHAGPDQASFQGTLLQDWAGAAAEISPAKTPILESWRDRRRLHVRCGRSELTVGHVDVLALPRSPGREEH